MSHCVIYCLKVDGEKVVNLIKRGRGIIFLTPIECFDQGMKGIVFEEGEFLGSDCFFEFSMASKVVLLHMPWKYTHLVIQYKPVCDEVSEYEKKLKAILDVRVIRVDEILVKEWVTIAGDAWINSSSSVSQFEKWLFKQEKEHWKLVAS